MPKYDGSVRIQTKIDNKKANSQLLNLENRITKTADKISSLKKKMDSLKDAKVPTKEYEEISAQIEKATAKFDKLYEKQLQMQQTGTDKGSAWDKLQYEMEEVGKEIEYAKGELQDLVDTGKAFRLGSDTEEFAKLSNDLKYAENEICALNVRHDELEAKAGSTAKQYKRLGNEGKKAFEKVNKTAKKGGGLLKTFGSRLKGILLSLLIFNWITKGFNAMVKAIKEGFTNMYNSSDSFKKQVDSLKASVTTLKNAFASAFEPLVQIAIPYIQQFVEWLTKALDLFAQFTAALTGQKTYTKALKQTAAATEDASKAAEGYLSPIDEINKYQTGQDSDDESAGTMFEEVPIDNKVLSWLDSLKEKLAPILDYANKLKNSFGEGFAFGLGDWEYRVDSIKNSLASIKESLTDIFTDPNVVSSMDKWANSFMFMLGSLAGSIASIGLTIATNLIGGIAKYLEQNKERIKEYLISMFDIWEEINYMFAGFFSSLAYIFEAFASEIGQQLTANIIGIFSEAFMGVMELASKLFRDLANIIIQPIVDNKEKFKQALEGLFSILVQLTGTIKDAIADTFAKLNEVYDANIKPLFDSIASGVSDIVAALLDFWNNTLQPIISEWASKFDELWKSHLQPFINSFIELIGSVANLVKSLWDNILKPLVEWFINNILPVLVPIFDTLYTTVVNVISGIADVVTNFINIFSGIVDLITALINGDWQAAWDACGKIVKNVFDAIFNTIQTILIAVIGVIDTALQTIFAIVESIFTAIKDLLLKFFEVIKEGSSQFFEWLTSNVDEKLNDVKETWDSIWDSFFSKVSDVWENIKNTISSAIEKVTGWVENLLSLFDKAEEKSGKLVSTSKKSSSFSFSLPTYSFTSSYSLPDIPGYATGQVIPRTMKKHLAYLGDNNKETEVVSPLSTIKQAVSEVMQASNGGTQVINLVLDGMAVAQTVISNGKVIQSSTGENPFELA